MSKLKIKIISLGILPFKFDKSRIENWNSEIFEIFGTIETHNINTDSDGEFHEYSDNNISKSIPKVDGIDFLIAITNVPLENNWYSRRLSEKTVCFTFFELADILRPNNIPIENLALRLLYSYSLIYKRFENRFPLSSESTNFAHSDTRKCLFDFNGIKSEIIFSTVKPVLCDECKSKLQKEKISKETIKSIEKELKRIDKDFYYKVTDFSKEKPFISFIITTIFALIMGIIGSIIYDQWIK